MPITGGLENIIFLLKSTAWITIPIFLAYAFYDLWMYYIQSKFYDKIKWQMVEVKIPKEVMKSPKAMEQVFAGFHGLRTSINLYEKYIFGKIQDWISLELIGTNGGSHFFIHFPERARNLIESYIYAQYPGAEIIDADNYTKQFPEKPLEQNYSMWGTEFILTKPRPYPLRTYVQFNPEGVEEERMIDPIAGFTELYSKTRENEWYWFQILIKPTGSDWQKEGQSIINKIMGRASAPKKPGPLSPFPEEVSGIAKEFIKEIGLPVLEGVESKKPEPKSLFQLTPHEQEVITAIGRKIAKIGFETKIRFIYIGKKDVFWGPNIPTFFGALRQFNTQDLNAFATDPYTRTTIDYFFKKAREKSRKERIFENYRNRKFTLVPTPYVLNIEELATLYHFPAMSVEAPLLPRIEAKKGEPPAKLPI